MATFDFTLPLHGADAPDQDGSAQVARDLIHAIHARCPWPVLHRLVADCVALWEHGYQDGLVTALSADRLEQVLPQSTKHDDIARRIRKTQDEIEALIEERVDLIQTLKEARDNA